MHKGNEAGRDLIFAVAFRDLSGAYDSVCRELLFEKLQKLVGLVVGAQPGHTAVPLQQHTMHCQRAIYTASSVSHSVSLAACARAVP